MKNLLMYCILIFPIVSCNSEKMENGGISNQYTANPPNNSEGWESLLNEDTLSNWVIFGSDKANFYLDNGVLIGESQRDIPSSFLATKKEYEDFILELEFNVSSELNSGIQIRSTTYPEETTTNYISGNLEKRQRTWEKGRVYGYQIEIDPSSRAWSGGFYEEGNRGWLQPLTDNKVARNAYKQEDWNTFKIIANDNHIQSWINGVKATDIFDNGKRSGFIAIQLHSANREEQIGKKIMFRNLRIKEIP